MSKLPFYGALNGMGQGILNNAMRKQDLQDRKDYLITSSQTQISVDQAKFDMAEQYRSAKLARVNKAAEVRINDLGENATQVQKDRIYAEEGYKESGEYDKLHLLNLNDKEDARKDQEAEYRARESNARTRQVDAEYQKTVQSTDQARRLAIQKEKYRMLVNAGKDAEAARYARSVGIDDGKFARTIIAEDSTGRNVMIDRVTNQVIGPVELPDQVGTKEKGEIGNLEWTKLFK